MHSWIPRSNTFKTQYILHNNGTYRRKRNGKKIINKRRCKREKKVEEALDYLLDVAIERFGYSACDVFRAVFDFDSTTTTFRRNSFNISFEQLNDIVASLVIGAVNFELSNPIVAISPVYSASNPLGDVDWKVAFNSGWVATEVMKKLNIAKNIDACLLRGIPH